MVQLLLGHSTAYQHLTEIPCSVIEKIEILSKLMHSVTKATKLTIETVARKVLLDSL